MTSNLAKYHNAILGLGSAWVAGYGAGIALGADEPGQIAGAGLAIGGTFLYLSNIKWPKMRYAGRKTLSHSIMSPFFKPKVVNIEALPQTFRADRSHSYFSKPDIGKGFPVPIPYLIFRERLKYAWRHQAYGKGMSDDFVNDTWWPAGLAVDYHKTFMAVLGEVQNYLKVNESSIVIFRKYDNNWTKLIMPYYLAFDLCYQYECLNGF